jgi:hypothetical protein
METKICFLVVEVTLMIRKQIGLWSQALFDPVRSKNLQQIPVTNFGCSSSGLFIID